MMDQALDFTQIIIADLILSGDNALIIGMAAAGLPPKLRKTAIFYGMVIAAVLRIIFAVIATKLLAIPGILFFGSVLLFWVCWRLFVEIRISSEEQSEAMQVSDGTAVEASDKINKKTLFSALVSITIADVSMSLDNVLAVAAIADGDTKMLVFGLGLAIILMAFAATLIMRLLTSYPWISWLGLAVLIYVASEMLFRGFFDNTHGIGPLFGFIDGFDLGKGH